ncbi:MAG: hypothetical protein VKK42_18965 [Lyngbya sp.]|nr:hypothetical protein [Lyngbya sp.]
MSLINNSALSCIATALGCTLTGMAVNEHLDANVAAKSLQPNPTGSIKLGIQQNPLMDAEDLMVAASNGVEQSVAPPEQMFTQNLTPTAEADDFSNFLPKQPEIWQQSPLDIGNLVVTARPQARMERPNVKPMGNFSNEYFPNYLNFDGDAEAPEPIEMARAELPQPKVSSEPMSVSDFRRGLEPVPAPPPLFEGEPIVAEYIVEPEAIISNNFEGIYPNNIVPQEQSINRFPSQYIVEPQSMTRVTPQRQPVRDNSQASKPELSVADSAKVAAQYVVEPRTVMAVFPGEQPQEISSSLEVEPQTVVEMNNLESANRRISRTPRANPRQTTVASATNPRPKLLQKLVEPYQSPSQVRSENKVSPVSSTPENTQINSERAANSVDEKAELIVAVESEFDTASEPIIEDSEEETEHLPSLLRKLVESYQGSSDILHDIKVSPSPLEASEAKFARRN